MLNEALKKEISIYWWNMGYKKLDYKGNYKGYLEKRNIKISSIKHPFAKDVRGIRFKFGLSSSIVRLDTFDGKGDYNNVMALDKAIMLLLTLLGDKSIFNGGYGKEYKINWR